MQIDKHIPIPQARTRTGRSGRRSMYPFREMDVGDSVFFPGVGGAIQSCKPYMAAATVAKRDKAFRFTGRKVVEDGQRGVRIWRVG